MAIASPPLHAALKGWQHRNIEQFGEPRVSGDDCHETARAQLHYLIAGGFDRADVIWQKSLWSVLLGTRNPTPGADENFGAPTAPAR